MSTTTGRLPSAVPANWVSGPQQGKWTYRDYVTLPDDGNHYEVVHGVLYMSPSPNKWHQRTSIRIASALLHYVEYEAQIGEVYEAPFDVVVNADNTVQPDVLVVLNKHRNRVTKDHVVGAPDLVVEIVSPSTARIDLGGKLYAYADAGVPEYWIVNPDARTVELLVLEQGQYSSLGVFYGPATLPSPIVPGITVRVEQFFA